MRILVTGGAGYIGSHTVVELLGRGDDVAIVDSLVNADVAVLDRIERIAGRRPDFHHADVRDREALDALLEVGLSGGSFDAAIHFAGLKAVGDSVQDPLGYWNANVHGAQVLLDALNRHGVHRFVFSSTAMVYAPEAAQPLREDSPIRPANPYGQTKLAIEQMLQALAAADDRWRVSILRYFNPVGAHPSGEIGEAPTGTPNNLMPYLAQVAVGRRERLRVFGDDYDTPDGTGVRDYVHVVDLARGHLAALEALERHPGCRVHNLGTGRGTSVLEMIHTFARTNDLDVPYTITDRRAGDVPTLCAAVDLASSELNWTAHLDLEAMCRDTWNWQRRNPEGYGTPPPAAASALRRP